MRAKNHDYRNHVLTDPEKFGLPFVGTAWHSPYDPLGDSRTVEPTTTPMPLVKKGELVHRGHNVVGPTNEFHVTNLHKVEWMTLR